ncbi:MAG: DUF1016 family protein [Bacilli bacterium]|nr:DUF1016 family protein [Bacilli bacterium]
MIEILDKDFKKVIQDIKTKINETKVEIFQNANMSLLNLYYYIAKILVENSKYGNNFINNLSIELKLSYPNMKGFSVRNLKNMRKYYLICSKNEKVQKASALIPWSHNILILDKVKDDKKRIWYMNQTYSNGWGYNNLLDKIKYDVYSRQQQGNKLNNFNMTLSRPQNEMAKEIMKDPYIFDITTLKEDYIEKELELAMVDKIKMTLLELGNGFSFIGNQYRLTIDNEDYFIDLLFYHIRLHCYIVIELKNTKFKPEYAGKMNFYLSIVDDKLKGENDNPSIGLILCKEKNKFSVEYTLKDINKPIGVSSYELTKYLPKNILNELPTEEELNLHIDINE